jgi:hypothetical protein
VTWALPPVPFAPSVPTSCEAPGYPFLRRPSTDRPRIDERGATICEVAQLVVIDGAVRPGTVDDGRALTDGWYYDDFSGELQRGCAGRIEFTPAAKPPTGVRVRMQCTGAVGASEDDMCSSSDASADNDSVGEACLPATAPEGGFDDTQVYVDLAHADCSGGPCIAYHLRGDPGPDCVPNPGSGVVCPSPQEVRDRLYCSCRCDAPEGALECACPDGFSCVTLFDQGGPAVVGGYCVRNGTFTE